MAQVSDGFAPQTNIVRQDGRRGVLVTVLKAGNASTLDVVNGIRKLLPRVATTLPPELKIQPLADQSIFVRAAVSGVIREAIIAACLTGLMILLFLGSWRSTLIIAVSIPLSILTSVIVLSFLGETINIMTLGGLALAVGILVDDATVTIENIERYLEEGHELHEAILEGAGQIAVPALVSTLCICIVFLPMFFLGGVARYLFVPLAEAVVFAMLASYILSRTLVPTLAMYLLKAKHSRGRSRAIRSSGSSAASSAASNACASRYQLLLTTLVYRRMIFVPVFLGLCAAAFRADSMARPGLLPEHRQRPVHSACARQDRNAHRGDRAALRPGGELHSPRDPAAARWTTSSTTSACPTARSTTCTATSGLIGAADADILVSLNENHHPTADYIRELRRQLAARVSRRDVLLSAGRHRHADSELRSARADRHSDRRRGCRRQPRSRRHDAGADCAMFPA